MDRCLGARWNWCPSHLVGTAWRPPKVKAPQQHLPCCTWSIPQWEPRWARCNTTWFRVIYGKKKNGKATRDYFTFSPQLRGSEPPQAKFVQRDVG